MGLGPRGDGRAGPPRRAGPMMTAIVFGSLIFGGWRRAPPSASAGPPRLWRRPTALRGDVCGDARACAAGGTRSRRCLPHRSAKPPGLVSAARPACVVSFLAMAGELSGEASALLCRLGLHERVGPVFAREGIDEDSLLFVSVEDLVGVGVAAEDARRIVSAVAVPDEEPVEAVPDAEPVEAVAVLAMAQPRGKGNVLTNKDMTEEQKHALGKTGAGLLETSSWAHLPRSVQTACRDDAFVRAVQTELGLKKPPASSLLETAIKLYRAQPTLEPPKNIRAPPKRRGPPSSNPSPPPKRAATSAPLAEQNVNTGESAIVAVAPQTALVAVAQHALRALNGETQTTKTGKQKVKVKTAGGDWVEYESRSEALRRVSGLKDQVLRSLLGGNASASDKFEACLVSNKRPISKPTAYCAAARALGFRQGLEHATDLDAAVSELVDRAVLPDSVKVRPKSWEALLKYVVSSSSHDQSVLVAQTRRAEDERVLKSREAACMVGLDVLRVKRREEAEEGRRRDVEALRDLLNLGYNLRSEKTQRAFEGEVKVTWLPSYVVDDDGPVYVEYKGDHKVQLKAGPWFHRHAIGDGNLQLGSAGGADNPYGSLETLVATITRPEAGDFAWLDRDGACGDRGLLHRGDGGRFAVTLTARVPAWAYVRRRPFSSLDQMRKLGFRLVSETAATTASGETIEGFGTRRFTFHVDEDGPDQMPALREEFLRFRRDLLCVTSRDKRLAEGVYASTRRTQNGATDAPQVVSFQFVIPCRATGATPRTERALQHLKDQGYPLMATLDHRCILNSVAFEFLAYRDPSVGGKWHVDQAKDLLLSALQMKSVTMKEDANLKRSKQHFTREDVAQMEECSDDDAVI